MSNRSLKLIAVEVLAAALVVLAARVRGLWLIEEHLPHDPRRKRNKVSVLHDRPDRLIAR